MHRLLLLMPDGHVRPHSCAALVFWVSTCCCRCRPISQCQIAGLPSAMPLLPNCCKSRGWWLPAALAAVPAVSAARSPADVGVTAAPCQTLGGSLLFHHLQHGGDDGMVQKAMETRDSHAEVCFHALSGDMAAMMALLQTAPETRDVHAEVYHHAVQLVATYSLDKSSFAPFSVQNSAASSWPVYMSRRVQQRSWNSLLRAAWRSTNSRAIVYAAATSTAEACITPRGAHHSQPQDRSLMHSLGRLQQTAVLPL